MSPEEKLEMGRKLIAEAEAEIAANRRNWPEKIERGMCFGSNRTKAMWMATDKPGSFVCIRCSGDNGTGIGATLGDLKDSTYIGHARDLIKIADDAHEPTGAELVGKMCYVSDDGVNWHGPWRLESHKPTQGWSWGSHETWYQHARLAR